MADVPDAGLRRNQVTYLLEFVTLATLYVAAARFGLRLNAASGFAALVWPPTGISLAALLIFGYRLWPASWSAPPSPTSSPARLSSSR